MSDQTTLDQIADIKTKITRDTFQNYLEPEIQHLLADSVTLLEYFEDQTTMLTDHSVVVFPSAKAFEGFLKQLLRDLGLITPKVYASKRFRIGRALNPDIRQSQRDEWWLFDDVAEVCGHDPARELWDTWLSCRNRLVHYFPGKPSVLEYHQALSLVEKVVDNIDYTLRCNTEALASV